MSSLRAQVPNLLTVIRLFSLPLVLFLANEEQWLSAALVYLLAACLDIADGWLARKWDARSAFGAYLDPVVDKIVILAMFYELARLGLVPIAAAHAMLTRELLHNAVRVVGAARGRVIGSNWMGKTKATMQNAMVVCGLALPSVIPYVDADTSDGLLAALRVLAWVVVLLAWMFFAAFLTRNSGVVFAPPGQE